MMVAASETHRSIAPLIDSLGETRLCYTNEGGAGFCFVPAQLTLTLQVPILRRHYPTADRATLTLPAGWRLVDDSGPRPLRQHDVTWTVVPAGRPETCRQGLSCVIMAGEQQLAVLEHTLSLELRGRSQFDPQRNTLPFRNAASDFGAVEPQSDLFRRTYRAGGMILPQAFFRGLYRDIAFLSPTTDERGSGGLCTGMARFALQQSARRVQALVPESRETEMREVQVWHGRQLTDRALLASARQFFVPSATAAYLTFRRQILDHHQTAVAFDVGIARWEPSLRQLPAIVRRLVTTGHTITPYAFRQGDDDTAEVAVYDPSYPDPADWAENVVRFDLARDRYSYRGFGSLETDDPSTVLAVAQENFAAPGTAYLASLASLALHPGIAVQEVRKNPTVQRALLALLAGLFLLSVAGRRRREDISLEG